jgi:hypothetical protein
VTRGKPPALLATRKKAGSRRSAGRKRRSEAASMWTPSSFEDRLLKRHFDANPGTAYSGVSYQCVIELTLRSGERHRSRWAGGRLARPTADHHASICPGAEGSHAWGSERGNSPRLSVTRTIGRLRAT